MSCNKQDLILVYSEHMRIPHFLNKFSYSKKDADRYELCILLDQILIMHSIRQFSYCRDSERVVYSHEQVGLCQFRSKPQGGFRYARTLWESGGLRGAMPVQDREEWSVSRYGCLESIMQL